MFATHLAKKLTFPKKSPEKQQFDSAQNLGGHVKLRKL
jgi:hypothetical protein